MTNVRASWIGFLGLAICISISVQARDIPLSGDKAPDFGIELLGGEYFTLTKERKNAEFVYIFFFTPWCESYVKETYPEMAQECADARNRVLELYKKHRSRVAFIGIGSRYSAGPKSVESYRKKFDIPFLLAFDESDSVFTAYLVRHFPTHIVIGRDGTIHHRVEGANVDSRLFDKQLEQ